MKLNLPVKYHIRTIEKEVLMNTFKQEEVLSYCGRCSNYGKNHSCPSGALDTLGILGDYKYVTVILTEIPTDAVENRWEEIEKRTFDSRVLTNYIKARQSKDEAQTSVDQRTALSMYVFNHVKDVLTDLLIEAEGLYNNAYSSPPGSCTKCVVCSKKQMMPCVEPETLRYSLEAFGFMVSDVYKQVFDLELGWQKDKLPEAFHSCSALFSYEPLDESEVLDGFIGKLNSITL